MAVQTGRLINCYRELVLGQGKTSHVLQSVLGQALKDDIGAASVRAMGRGNQKNWVVGDGKLFELADAGTITERGAVADDANTTIGGNYTDVTIVSGGNYYVWDGATVSEPTTLTFSNVGSHCYVGGYTVLLEEDGKRFQWSDIGDAQSLDALNFASADKVDDNLLRGVEVRGNLVLFGERSTEIWQVTGQANTTAFAYVTAVNRGIKGFNLLTKFGDTVFFVGDDNNVYIGVGDGAVDITTPAINTSLTNDTPTHCFYYEDRGHQFCVIRFSDRPAWVYDVKMREWHERAEGAGNLRWRAVAAVEGGTSWLVGNDVGEILELARTNTDINAPLRRTAVSVPVYLGTSKFRISKFEVNARVGETTLNSADDFGLSVGDGFGLEVDTGFALLVEENDGTERDAIINLRESKDGGRTWGETKARSMGRFGDYDKRMIWRARGQANQYSVELMINEPADIQLNTTAVLELV